MRVADRTADHGERALRRRRHIEHLLAYGLDVDSIATALELPRSEVAVTAVRWRAAMPARSRPPRPSRVFEHAAVAA